MIKIMVTALTLSISSVSFADQCAVVETKIAKSFLKLVKKGADFGKLCEPCGEQPSELGGPFFESVETISIKPWPGSKGAQSTILVNGKQIDLAYSYLNTAQGEYYTVSTNAAFLVGCPTKGVTNQFIIGD